MFPSYRNQSVDLQSKSIDWLLYDGNIGRYRVKKRSEQNRLYYVKQRNYCVSPLWKTKKDYYANLNVKDIIDNKQFWRTVKPLTVCSYHVMYVVSSPVAVKPLFSDKPSQLRKSLQWKMEQLLRKMKKTRSS